MKKIKNQSKNSIAFIMISVFSTIGFLILYIMLNATSVEPYYIQGLILSIPTIFIILISVLHGKKKIPFNISLYLVLLTIAISIAFFVAVMIYFGFNSATTKTTDTERYDKALDAIGYPNNIASTFLPAQIPIDAENIEFSYQPAFVQGGEYLSLIFDAHSDVIDDYFDFFNANARRLGSYNKNMTEENGIYSSSLRGFTDDTGRLPSDLQIFLIYSKGSGEGDFNHGEVSFVAISKAQNRILFSYENW